MMIKKITKLCLIFCVSTPVLADTLASVDPGTIINTLSQTLPGAQGPTSGALGVGTNPQVIENASNIDSPITLKQVVILGAEHPVPANVTAVYQSMIGKPLRFKDIQTMVNQMEATYRADGNILVQVILPPQQINPKTGVVQIQIVEGQIQNVIFTGDNAQAARAQLQRYAAQIEAEDPITYHTLDRFLNLANQLPGIDVSATLVPDKKVVGAADLIIQVDQTPVSAFVNFNNRGTQYIGPGQASVGASIYDILGADAFSLAGATSTSNPNQMYYGSASYDIIAGPYGTEINPVVTSVSTQPGSSLSAFQMEGQSTQYTLNVNQPLWVSTPQNLTLQTAFSHINSRNNIFETEPLYQDNITTLSLGLDYQGLWLGGYNDLNFSGTAGLPIFGAPNTEPNPSIANGRTEFSKFNFLGSHIQYLTQKISFALGAQAQITGQTMLASEQIGYGGQTFGQAFIPYVISGDNGAFGSVALRYDLPLFAGINLLQPQVFYDAGTVSLNHPPAGSANGASGQSAGLGLMMQLVKTWQVGLTLAKPIKITQTNQVDMSWQGFINVTGSF